MTTRWYSYIRIRTCCVACVSYSPWTSLPPWSSLSCMSSGHTRKFLRMIFFRLRYVHCDRSSFSTNFFVPILLLFRYRHCVCVVGSSQVYLSHIILTKLSSSCTTCMPSSNFKSTTSTPSAEVICIFPLINYNQISLILTSWI